MKLRNTFLILYSIWFLDYLTTILSLNFFGLSESNHLAAFFYSHWWGWLIFPVITAIFVFALSGIISLIEHYTKRKFTNKDKNYVGIVIRVLIMALWIILESLAVIHNIKYIIVYR